MILILEGVSYHAVVVFTLGYECYDFSSTVGISNLGRCVKKRVPIPVLVSLSQISLLPSVSY